jgi:hypothetical protein
MNKISRPKTPEDVRVTLRNDGLPFAVRGFAIRTGQVFTASVADLGRVLGKANVVIVDDEDAPEHAMVPPVLASEDEMTQNTVETTETEGDPVEAQRDPDPWAYCDPQDEEPDPATTTEEPQPAMPEYSGGGWWIFEGKKTRTSDLPDGIREAAVEAREAASEE